METKQGVPLNNAGSKMIRTIKGAEICSQVLNHFSLQEVV